MEYELTHKGQKVKFILIDLTIADEEEIIKLLKEIQIEGSKDLDPVKQVIENSLEITYNVAEKGFKEKLLSIILAKEDGSKETPEFFKGCLKKETNQIMNDFFFNEGKEISTSILNWIGLTENSKVQT